MGLCQLEYTLLMNEIIWGSVMVSTTLNIVQPAEQANNHSGTFAASTSAGHTASQTTAPANAVSCRCNSMPMLGNITLLYRTNNLSASPVVALAIIA